MEERKLVEYFFLGMSQSKELVPDKDTANKMDDDFRDTSVAEFIDEMYHEVMDFDGDESDRHRHMAGVGVLTREFFEYKLAHPQKKDESKTNKDEGKSAL